MNNNDEKAMKMDTKKPGVRMKQIRTLDNRLGQSKRGNKNVSINGCTKFHANAFGKKNTAQNRHTDRRLKIKKK